MRKKIVKKIAQVQTKDNKGKTSIINRTGKDTNLINVDPDTDNNNTLITGTNGGVNLVEIIKKDEN